MQNRSIINDQVIAIKKHIPLILLVNLPLVIALTWIYWQQINHRSLLFWGGSMLLVMLVRLVAFIYVTTKKPAQLDNVRQQNILVFNSALSGLLWAWAGYLFFVPEKLEYQLIILMVIIIKGMGSMSSIVNNIKAFYAYFPVSMLPITLMFFLQANPTSILLGVISLSVVFIMLVFARNMNDTLMASLKIRYENQQLLEETEARKQEAEKANRAKTQFLAAASHDLRQPLHAMSLLINILEEQLQEGKDNKILARLAATNDALKNLLDSLLDVSRLDAGAVEAVSQDVSLENLFIELENEFQLLAEEKGLVLTFSKTPPAVNTDPALLQQVLRNLLANSLRYTEVGRIVVTASLDNEQVVITVEDTGIGISSNQQQMIFDEFYQVGNQERDRQHGLGLGLSIVQRTLNLLGSKITLESELYKGSKFSFSLPATHQQVTNIVVQKESSVNIQGQGEVIAIIEDDKQAGESLQLLLESWGYRAYLAGNSEILINDCNKLRVSPQVIVSDFQLNDNMNGVEEIKKIRECFGEHLPALLITGNIHAEENVEVKEANFPLLYKPVSPAKLRAFLRVSLND